MNSRPDSLDARLLQAKEPVEAKVCPLCGAIYVRPEWLQQHKISWHKQDRELQAPKGVASDRTSKPVSSKEAKTARSP